MVTAFLFSSDNSLMIKDSSRMSEKVHPLVKPSRGDPPLKRVSK